MKLGRCPVCHSHLALEALAADDAARELLALLAAQDSAAARALLGYLGLFRPAAQDLRWDRALRLARETLALEADSTRLCAALETTVEALRAKAGTTALRNHNYLRRVLEALPVGAPAPIAPAAHTAAPRSRAGAAIDRLLGGAGEP